MKNHGFFDGGKAMKRIEAKDYFNIFYDGISDDVTDQEKAKNCLKEFYGVLKGNQIRLYQAKVNKNRLAYMLQFYCFKEAFKRQNYVECCRQIEELVTFYPMTKPLRINMIYLFHETIGKMESVTHKFDKQPP